MDLFDLEGLGDEDFMNFPLDSEDENNQNLINRNEQSLSNVVDLSGRSDPVFDDFDDEDDERFSSVVEDFNAEDDDRTSSFVQHPPLIINLGSQRQESITSSNESTTLDSQEKNYVQERLDSFVRPVVSSHGTPNNEVTFFNESPSMSNRSLEVEYERKFPGPAGLRLKKSLDSSFEGKFNKSGFKKQLNASGTEDVLTNNTNWSELMKEISAKSYEQSKILNEFTVIALERKNNFKLSSRKIPVFAAVLSSVDSSVSDPSVRLKDLTGEIRGTLSRDLWEQYSHLLVVGSALLLRHVSMLSFSNSRMLHLNITTNNIDTIYSHHPDSGSVLTTRVTSTALSSLYEKLSDDVKIDLTTSNGTNHSVISTNEMISKNSFENSSVSLRVPSIDSELEGIDVNSLFEDF